MAKANADATGSQKTVPADCVAVLLMALGHTSVSKAQYEMMSAVDGTRTASSFEHQFRSITAKVKELKRRTEEGESFTPVKPTNKRGGNGTPASFKTATPKKRKSSDDDSEDTPSKKRATPKGRGKKALVDGDVEDDLPEDMEIIKRERECDDEI